MGHLTIDDCHPSSRVRHWTEPTTLRKISVTLLLSWSIELNLQHLELKNVPKNSEVGWQESGISPTFHGNRVTPKKYLPVTLVLPSIMWNWSDRNRVTAQISQKQLSPYFHSSVFSIFCHPTSMVSQQKAVTLLPGSKLGLFPCRLSLYFL